MLVVWSGEATIREADRRIVISLQINCDEVLLVKGKAAAVEPSVGAFSLE